jgi:hypothetical protein
VPVIGDEPQRHAGVHDAGIVETLSLAVVADDGRGRCQHEMEPVESW